MPLLNDVTCHDMNPLELADQYATQHAIQLSDTARRVIAIGLGLGGSSSSCDDAFLSIGLRRANSLLALLADKYDLDFSALDEDAGIDAEQRGDEIVDEELRYLGLRKSVAVDDVGILIFDERDENDANEAIPSAEEYESVLELIEKHHDVLGNAVHRASRDHRTIVESFDLLAACADGPSASVVFDQGGIKEESLRSEIARYCAIGAVLREPTDSLGV